MSVSQSVRQGDRVTVEIRTGTMFRNNLNLIELKLKQSGVIVSVRLHRQSVFYHVILIVLYFGLGSAGQGGQI